MSAIITIPCCFFIDEATAIQLNIMAMRAAGQNVPNVATKPARLTQAILAGADELTELRTLQPAAVSALKASGINLREAWCDSARVDYLDNELAPVYTKTIGTPGQTANMPTKLFFVPCEKTLSYTKRAYASTVSVIREFSGYLTGLLPNGFDLSAHICSLTMVTSSGVHPS